MTPQEILELEISLLLVKYGRTVVIKALATRLNTPPDALERELEYLCSAEIAAKKKKHSKKPFELAPLLVSNADKAELLQILSSRYENRTFLPELKDVKRFFARNGVNTSAEKSRAIAKEPLFKTLASLSVDVLQALCAEPEDTASTSSLGVISDEILRRNR